MTSMKTFVQIAAKKTGMTEEDILALLLLEDSPAKDATAKTEKDEPKAKRFTYKAFRAMKAKGMFPKGIVTRAQCIEAGLVPDGYTVPKSATDEAKAERAVYKAEHPEAVTTKKAEPKKSAKKAAVAAQRERDAKGQFLPGSIKAEATTDLTPDQAAKVLTLVEAGFTKDEAMAVVRQATKA